MLAKSFQKDIFQKRMSHSEYLRHAWASPNGFPGSNLEFGFLPPRELCDGYLRQSLDSFRITV